MFINANKNNIYILDNNNNFFLNVKNNTFTKYRLIAK